jgi:hypothetical protein
MQVIKFVRNTVLLVSLVSVAASCSLLKERKKSLPQPVGITMTNNTATLMW